MLKYMNSVSHDIKATGTLMRSTGQGLTFTISTIRHIKGIRILCASLYWVKCCSLVELLLFLLGLLLELMFISYIGAKI